MGKVDDEVQELRKQVERLSAEKASTDSPQERSASEHPAADEGNDLSSLRAKLEEFMGTLDRDLQQIPATTAIGIFALGVLMGRLLPR
jgi:hypothetical protein